MNIYGLLGEKLGHSMSPEIHNRIFKYAGIDGEYKLFPVKREELGKYMNDVRSGNIKGLSVTIPYKTDVIKYLDGVSEEAEYIGAVNTICMKGDKLIGFNTDSLGFKKTLENNDIQVKGKNAAILGTGGASKAVKFVLESMGAASVDLFSRTPNSSQKGYKEIDKNHKYQIIINATPLGMSPNTDSSPIEKETIGNAEAVVDLIYNPMETKLLGYAKGAGKKAVNGMYMLIAQAVKAQEIFNSVKIDEGTAQKIYNDISGGK